MQRTVKLFVIPKGHGNAAPEPRPAFSVEGDSLDHLKRSAHEHLRAEGLRVRSVSFAPDGLLAYAEVAA